MESHNLNAYLQPTARALYVGNISSKFSNDFCSIQYSVKMESPE